MELKAHFQDIHRVIADLLAQAEHDILVAMAWFTDRELFELLCQKSRQGLHVQLALMADDINQRAGALNFDRLTAAGGTVTFFPAPTRDQPLMHHKFCVIDRRTVITGSYNWTHKARSNDENITVVQDAPEFAQQFVDVFAQLLQPEAPPPVDAQTVRRRLEMVRNLILLAETDDLPAQLSKLHTAQAGHPRLQPIVDALHRQDHAAALTLIEGYLNRTSALVVAEEADLAPLRLSLRILEVQLEAVSDELAETERVLLQFNRRHDEALGEILRELLRLQAELARRQAEQHRQAAQAEALTEPEQAEAQAQADQADAEAEQAQTDYEEFTRQHEALQQAAPLRTLDEAEEKELKTLYRKCCSLAHPDRVGEEDKQAAHEVFIELQQAYQDNDLVRVREVHAALKAGTALNPRSVPLQQAGALRSAIVRLEGRLRQVTAELQQLLDSPAMALLRRAGATEAKWQEYFAQQAGVLSAACVRLRAQIEGLHGEVEA